MTTRLCLALLALLASCNRTEVSGKTHVIAASYGTRYKLHVTLPDGYDAGKAGGYRMLLYTDLSYLQPEVLKALDGAGLREQMIVVGIGYEGENRRTEDFSPTRTSLKKTGNAPDFADFIEKEVLGYLSEHYAIADSEHALSFCGHSLGGLFGTYLFLKKPGLFYHYLLISPSLMWDEQAIFRIEADRRPQSTQAVGKLFLATGSMETGGFHTTRQHLTGLLKEHYPLVDCKERVFTNKDHSGVVSPALAEGFRFMLESSPENN